MKLLPCSMFFSTTLLTGATVDVAVGYLYTLPWILCGISIIALIFMSYIFYKEGKAQDEIEHQKLKEKFLNKGDIDGK